MTKEKKQYDEGVIIARLQDPALQADAFSEIVKRHSEQIYWHIRRMVLTHDDANDILQNTFIKAWNGINNFRGESQISTWLYRIAINETLTFLNHKQPQQISLDTVEGSIAEQLESDIYFNGEHADALLHEAISTLPEKQRIIFDLKYFQEKKYEEISEILGTSIGALKASYHIAVKKIENYLNNKD
ncbi:MAG: sigma-70 family RNA polymerase sigma factor [Bacteroidales bacterium]|nr:sigma-70 family RNA polymerase sigma factor [Bacteroidales bacterium]